MGGMLLMCQNTTMRVYGARIKRYWVLCSKHIAVRVVLSWLPAGSRQATWWRPYLWDWSIGAAPTGAAPTTSEWSTSLLPTQVSYIRGSTVLNRHARSMSSMPLCKAAVSAVSWRDSALTVACVACLQLFSAWPWVHPFAFSCRFSVLA